MSPARTMLRTTVAAGASAALLFCSAPVHAQPAPPLPIDAAQAPGLPAMESLGPVVQQAAADPTNAASMLMAAAAAFVGDTAAPTSSRDMASAVNSFVADPAAHVPVPGSGPGLVEHLPAGVNPAYAVGPVPEGAVTPPAPLPAPVPAPAPDAAPAPAAAPVAVQAAPAPAPAPGAATVPGPPGFGPDTPPTQDFMYPSISNGCLKDGGNVLATAISVAGPAKIPLPGPGPGQTAYVFTAVGTPGPAAEQKLPLNVTWVNLTTGKSGSAALKPRSDINPEGPTTLTAIVDTGSGSIMSTIFGQVTTTEKQCQFMPTIGSTVVP
ncbi:hypothetical protein ACN27E_24555 [Mycobacterium sp. WMMD1722]|uniref:Rv1157c family protein n=1 Tax=Mycobacterium sp. WMMD1722 TaxID=3404117 RepID=UPI003BF50D6B